MTTYQNKNTYATNPDLEKIMTTFSGSRRLKEVALTAAILRRRLLKLLPMGVSENVIMQAIRENLPKAINQCAAVSTITYGSVATKLRRELSGCDAFCEAILVLLLEGDLAKLGDYLESGFVIGKNDSRTLLEMLLRHYSAALR